MIRLAVFDMDGTLVDTNSSWGFVHDHFGERNEEGLRLFLAGQIDDHEFIRRDIRIWHRHRPDLGIDELETILARVPLMPGAEALFRGLRREGLTTAIVSGGIDLLARRVARDLSIGYALANGFEVDARGRLTGEGLVRVPVMQKEAALAQVQAQLGIDPSETASVGNSAIDVGLFRRSRVGVAFAPVDEAVRKGASAIVEERDLARVLPILASA
jgi:phosphoserine phosphatase